MPDTAHIRQDCVHCTARGSRQHVWWYCLNKAKQIGVGTPCRPDCEAYADSAHIKPKTRRPAMTQPATAPAPSDAQKTARKGIPWDGPAEDVIPGAGALLLWEYCEQEIAEGVGRRTLSQLIGCTPSSLDSALGTRRRRSEGATPASAATHTGPDADEEDDDDLIPGGPQKPLHILEDDSPSSSPAAARGPKPTRRKRGPGTPDPAPAAVPLPSPPPPERSEGEGGRGVRQPVPSAVPAAPPPIIVSHRASVSMISPHYHPEIDNAGLFALVSYLESEDMLDDAELFCRGWNRLQHLMTDAGVPATV